MCLIEVPLGVILYFLRVCRRGGCGGVTCGDPLTIPLVGILVDVRHGVLRLVLFPYMLGVTHFFLLQKIRQELRRRGRGDGAVGSKDVDGVAVEAPASICAVTELPGQKTLRINDDAVFRDVQGCVVTVKSRDVKVLLLALTPCASTAAMKSLTFFLSAEMDIQFFPLYSFVSVDSRIAGSRQIKNVFAGSRSCRHSDSGGQGEGEWNPEHQPRASRRPQRGGEDSSGLLLALLLRDVALQYRLNFARHAAPVLMRDVGDRLLQRGRNPDDQLFAYFGHTSTSLVLRVERKDSGIRKKGRTALQP